MRPCPFVFLVLAMGWIPFALQTAQAQPVGQPQIRREHRPEPYFSSEDQQRFSEFETFPVPAGRVRTISSPRAEDGSKTEDGSNAVGRHVAHLRMAAEHLHQAGFDEEAEKLRDRASQLEAELRKRLAGSVSTLLQEEIRELRLSIDELRQEVHFLRRQLQLQLPFKEGAGMSGKSGESQMPEARIRIPDRPGPITDDELDAVSGDRSRFDRLHHDSRRKPSGQRDAAPSSEEQLEFELVPVPAPDNIRGTPRKREPVPTPVPPSDPSKKKSPA